MSKGIFLDVDSSIVEKNLLFANAEEEGFGGLFQPSGDHQQGPSKLVKPFPGFCVKTKEIGDDAKFFINVCHTDAIPSPEDITENQLLDILQSEEPSSFRVPMSIGEIRSEKDKKGESAKTCDVAINPNFFKKIESIQLFKNFFLTIVFEAIKEKHGIICNDDKIILQNRKCFGNLQVHRIQQREIKEKMEEKEDNVNPKTRPLIEAISSVDSAPKEPEYRLFRRKASPSFLIGEFRFPDVSNAKDLCLDLGEDRILLECSRRNYLLDVFIPFIIRPSTANCRFDKSTKILTVTMPLVGG